MNAREYVSDSTSHRSVPGGLKGQGFAHILDKSLPPREFRPSTCSLSHFCLIWFKDSSILQAVVPKPLHSGLLLPLCHPHIWSPANPSARPLKYPQNPTTSPTPGWTTITSSLTFLSFFSFISLTFPVASSSWAPGFCFHALNSFSSQRSNFRNRN